MPAGPSEFSLADLQLDAWNANSEERASELRAGIDPAYDELTRLVISYLYERGLEWASEVLDAGCGLGYISGALADAGYQVTGIDPSSASIAIAKQDHGDHVEFEVNDLAEYSRSSGKRFGAIVANMTLQSVAGLQSFLSAAERLLLPGGFIFATIPNPKRYLQGRADIDVRNIDLTVDQILAIPFRIRHGRPHPSKVVFHHRPMRTYSYTASSAGLVITDFDIPERVGDGREGDITVLVFEHSPKSTV